MTHTVHQELENTSTYFSNADSLVETSRVLLEERYAILFLPALFLGLRALKTVMVLMEGSNSRAIERRKTFGLSRVPFAANPGTLTLFF